MDIEKLIEAVRLCGSTPKVDQCKRCAYWSGGDMSKCIPRMTTDEELEKQKILTNFYNGIADGYKEELEKRQSLFEQVKRERDAAVKDLNEFLAMDEFCPIQCEWCKWKDTFCDGKTPEWRGQKENLP